MAHDLTFTATPAQASALDGLAYWIAASRKTRERFPDDLPELERCRRIVCGLFDRLDALGVPFWVQNAVAAFADDWRRYVGVYMWPWLVAKGIYK